MAHLAHVTHPVHDHDRQVWVLPDSPLGRWTTWLAAGGLVLVLVSGVLVAAGADGPWLFLLLGLTLWSVVVAAGAGVLAAVALVRDHALTLGAVAVLGIATTAALALELVR